ncbi:DNA excision repair protein ERCC-6-like [Polypterus senegalus]|uniref:DNA excision repair protein ERCC-6-like n=1 Tax=Polypterus senegalus TaxID=55291 RepID=UPI0019627B78|nr:DNA excision repair protein ERCC-6-like [Polypterus senegalus]
MSEDDSAATSSSPDLDTVAKYQRLVKEGKEEARKGNLVKSLELFSAAYEIHQSEKLKSRIQRLEEAVKEFGIGSDEDDEFVNVNNSGLKIYRELHDKLFEHQKEGVAFLYSLFRDERKGGILADDMGLGKTIQIIAFLSGMFDSDLVTCALLVMPTTLIGNWTKEFKKWTPGMRVKEFHGTSKRERTLNLEKIQRRGGVLITTYQMLINNWQALSSFSDREFTWDYLILDEAHKIKSTSTKTAKCAHAIPAKNRILLTGTPVQNNLQEMWALFDFALKGTLLGTAKTFKIEYENPITRAREKDATPGEKALGLKISENLMSIIDPYFLRRTKQDVQDRKQQLLKGEQDRENLENQENINPNANCEMPSLTRKNDLIVWTFLSSVQEEIYRKFISLDQIKELLMTTRSPLAELNILKKLCDHPRLLSARACYQLGLENGDNNEDDLDENSGTAGKIDHLSDETLIEESGKLTFLIGLLERLKDEGNRTLVFSQSRKMLDIIQRVLVNRGFNVMRIDGTITHLGERERRIALFQNDSSYSVFLLTTQVGGVGITLTAANRVVIFDPSWNPATDAQAVDRAYRIGQKENVVIYRLITCGTVEEKIYRRQVFKDSLIRQTTGDKKNPFRYFSKQELKELFKLEETRSSTTQIQLQMLHARQRHTDISLDMHIAYLHTLNMFGISDHDLLFSCDSAIQDHPEDLEAQHYIENRVLKAQELVKAESELHQQFNECIKSNTEPGWLHKQIQPKQALEKTSKQEIPVSAQVTINDDSSSPSAVVDLTEESFEHEEEINNVSNKIIDLVLDSSYEEAEANNMEMLNSPRECSIKKEFNSSVTKAGSENLKNEYINGPSDFVSKVVNISDINMASPSLKLNLLNDDAVTSEMMYSPNKHLKDNISRRSQLLSPNNLAPKNETNDASMTSPCAVKTNVANFNLSQQSFYDMDKSNKFDVADPDLFSESMPQCDFKLQIDDSMDDLFEADKSDIPKPDFSLHISAEKSSGSLVKESPKMSISTENGYIKSNTEKSPTRNISSEQESDGSLENGEEEEDEDHMYHMRRKKKAHVIYDSGDEEDNANCSYEAENVSVNELDCFNSSPLRSSFTGISVSTPKQNIPLLHTSSSSLMPGRKAAALNVSVASRTSFVSAVMEDIEDMSESMAMEEDEEVSSNDYKSDDIEPHNEVQVQEDDNMYEVSASEKSTEDASVTGEDEEVEVESEASYSESDNSESLEDEQSIQDESTGNFELQSGENVDCFASQRQIPFIEQNTEMLCANELQSQDKEYDNLVNKGKELQNAGRLKEALDVFLKALDIKSGDPEIQLTTIRLYRQLSTS